MAMQETLKEYLIRIKYETDKQGDILNQQENINTVIEKYGATSLKTAKIVGHSYKDMTQKINGVEVETRKWFYSFDEGKGKIAEMTYAVNKSGGAILDNTQQLKIGATTAKSFGQNMTDLARRAAMTIPIWYALRQVVNTVLTTIREGMEEMKKLDVELQRLSMTLGDTEGKYELLNQVQERATQLSRETGKSVSEIVRAFYQFKTLGMDIETSMTGMETATKGSVAMMADLVPLSQILARSYNLLGDTMDKGATTQQNMEASLGKILALFENNDFVLNQFGESLDRFMATANTMNLTFDETIVYLASLHSGVVQGSRAGTLFRTTLMQLTNNLDKVGRILGLRVNPEVETTGEMFERILKRLRELNQSGDIDKVNEGLQDIFGGVRGGEVSRTLLAVFEMWEENAEMVRELGTDKAIEKFYKNYEDGLKRVNVQLDKLKNTRRELGREMITAFFGGEEFSKSLENLNSWIQDTLTPTLSGLATTLGLVSDVMAHAMSYFTIDPEKIVSSGKKIWNRLGKWGDDIVTSLIVNPLAKLSGIGEDNLSKESKTVLKRLPSLFYAETNKEEFEKMIKTLSEDKKIRKELSKLIDVDDMVERLKEVFEIVSKDPSLVRDLGKNISKTKPITLTSEIELETIKEQLEYQKMQILGYNEIEIAKEKSIRLAEKLVKSQSELKTGEKETLDVLTAQELINEVRLGNYEKIKYYLYGIENLEKEIAELVKTVTDEDSKRLENILKYAQQVKSVIQGTFDDILAGTGSLADIGVKFGEMFRKGVSESLTRKFLDFSGLDVIFGNLFSEIENAHVTGMKLGIELLKQFYNEQVINQGNTIRNTISGGIEGIPASYSGGIITYQPTGVYQETGQLAGLSSSIDWRPSSQSASQQKQSQRATYGNIATLLASSYAGYQSAGGGFGGVVSGLGGLGMGLHSLGFMGAGTAGATGFATLFGPIGLGLAAAGMLISSMSKSKSTSVQEQTTEKQIAPKIDITNKNLEVINRNLIALRSDIRTYVLPGSAYWSTKNNLEDQFSLHARMGLLN